jgi:hypothetical protein
MYLPVIEGYVRLKQTASYKKAIDRPRIMCCEDSDLAKPVLRNIRFNFTRDGINANENE